MTEPVGTYPFPAHGWTCFHCGEEFSIAAQRCRANAEKAAREHFGADPLEEPLCKIATHPLGELARRVREAEMTAAAAIKARDSADEEAEMANCRLSSLGTLFPGALSPHDAHCQFESMEGRALAAEAIIDRLAEFDYHAVQQAREYVCRPVEENASLV